ncbi:class I SAM-dependent methyltransferase [Gaoshiqia sp. Z1-71]|uniref:class I SAM-dependent methyltransferase n=1 Tax=Gaoshiqia hydrogeniformans TaxID=3290090 RepID=UPI003BF8F2D5
MDQDRFYSSITNYYEQIFPLNKQQLEFVMSEFSSLEDFYFLDAGCSTGQLANELSRHGALGCGIDLNGEMIKRAMNLFASPGLSFRKLNMLHLDRSFPPRYFDAVICFGNTLVHLDSVTQIKNFFKQAVCILKPGGKLLLQQLNYDQILEQQLTELPLIENEQIRFERHYVLPKGGQSKIEFHTRLTIKDSGESLENSVALLPVKKNELEKLLILAGFKQVRFYANFAKAPYTGDHLPLVMVADC